MVDVTPSSMDDLLGFGVPNSLATTTASIPVASAPTVTQYSTRREQRAAEAAAAAAIAPAPVQPTPVFVALTPVALPTRRAQVAGGRRSPRASGRARGASFGASSRKLRRTEVAAIHAAAPTSARKKPASVLATIVVVTGLFAVAGLPAYAISVPSATLASNDVQLGSQSVAVSKDALAAPLQRDGYRATTPEQMEEMSKDNIRASNNTEYLASGARALGDDYPWYYELADYQGGGLSPLNYYYRQCTDFVAWRLNRDAGSFDTPYKYVWSNLTPTGGNASQWKSAWDAQGWTTSSNPIVGSVAWFGWSNHVAYVKAVLPDGNVVIEEYNYVPSVYSQRTIPASSVASFLYPPTYAG